MFLILFYITIFTRLVFNLAISFIWLCSFPYLINFSYPLNFLDLISSDLLIL